MASYGVRQSSRLPPIQNPTRPLPRSSSLSASEKRPHPSSLLRCFPSPPPSLGPNKHMKFKLLGRSPPLSPVV